MFIKKSFAHEIASSMEDQLISGLVDKYAEAEDRFVKIAEHLNAAAEIFEEMGLDEQAETATELLESLAAKKKKKKKKPTSKSPTSNEMVDNLKEKGWVFNDASDHNCAMCGSDLNKATDQFVPENDIEDFEDEWDAEFYGNPELSHKYF